MNLSRMLLQVVMVVYLSLLPAVASAETKSLDLGDGYRFELLSAGETPGRVASPKTLYINITLTDPSKYADKTRLIEGLDRVFETVLLNGAEKGYYTRARINLRKPGTNAYQVIVYLRGDNSVWLRQAGTEPWMLAQSAKWTSPVSRKVDIKDFGTLMVEQTVSIEPPEGFKRAAEIDLVSKTNIVNLQQKFQEIKALWSLIDRKKMLDQGYDLVLIGSFSTPQLGRFHARKGFFIRIPRTANNIWAELPDSVPDSRDTLLSKNELPIELVTKSIQRTFASGLDAMRLSEFIMPGFDATGLNLGAQVGFAEGAPVIRFNPEAFPLPLP